MPVEARDRALGELQVAPAAIDALGQLAFEERAALIAGAIERLDLADVATVLDRKLGTTRQLLRTARLHYLAAAGRSLDAVSVPALPAGELWQRVEREAAWAVGRSHAQDRP
jgi:DNA-directed RNA polymerase specialized sigma24 family protein